MRSPRAIAMISPPYFEMRVFRRLSKAQRFVLVLSAFHSLSGCRASDAKTFRLEPAADETTEVPRWSLAYQGLVVVDMSLDDEGRSGFALTATGRALRLSSGRWAWDSQLETLAPAGIDALHASRDGKTAWAFDGSRALKYNGREWKAVDSVTHYRGDPIWISRDGTQGTVATSGVRLSGGAWTDMTWNAGSLDLLALQDDGKVGWAQNEHDRLLRFADGQWTYRPDSISLVLMEVTTDGVFIGVDRRARVWRAAGEQWELLDDVQAVGDVAGLWPELGAQSAWIVGSEGVFRWERGRPLVRVSPNDDRRSRGIWMNTDGTRGFVFGEDAIQRRFEHGTWQSENPMRQLNSSLGDKTFQTLGMSRDGERGWILGERGSAGRYESGHWRPDSIPARVRHLTFWKMALDASATAGWAVGDSGAVMQLADGHWTLVVKPAPTAVHAICPVLWPDGETLLASVRGRVSRFNDGTWLPIEAPGVHGRGGSRCMWRDRTVGDLVVWHGDSTLARYRMDGNTLRESTNLESSKYTYVFPEADGAWGKERGYSLDEDLLSPLSDSSRKVPDPDNRTFILDVRETIMWIDAAGQRGVAFGSSGIAQYLINGSWYRDRMLPVLPASRDSVYPIQRERYPIKALWMHHTGRHGWAVGEVGTILRIESDTLPSVALHVARGSSLETLSGDLMLQRVGGDSLHLDGITVANCSDPPLPLRVGTSYRLERVSAGTIRVRFTPGFREHLSARYRNSRCAFQFRVILDGILDVGVPVTLVQTFYISGRPPWHFVVGAVGGLLLANLLLVLIATRSRWLRGVILSPVGASLVGLVVGRYLIIEPLVRHVRPIRLAMLRDYRRGLRSSPAVERWKGQQYIPPRVAVDERAPGTPHDGEMWAGVFERICTATRGRVWLVEGPSGLGKTALLERWLALALERGRTPLLLRFGPGGTVLGEAVLALAQYGDVRLQEDAVLALLEAGGFLLLLDGLNEDRNPEATRAFIRRTSSRNVIVVSSQFDPGWGGDIRIEAVRLSRFGREQLLHLLPAEWVDRLLGSIHLGDAVRLPQTARLIAHFVRQFGRLPDATVEVYESLREALPTGDERLNLEVAAWTLFRDNSVVIPEAERLSDAFLAKAVEAGVLTALVTSGQRRHRFVHERVHRYFVACHLAGQPHRMLDEWHRDLREGLPRTYWREVLDLWSEIYALSVHAGRASVSGYEDFLRQVGAFDVEIFRDVYRQVDRFATTKLVTPSAGFIVDAARVLARSPEG